MDSINIEKSEKDVAKEHGVAQRAAINFLFNIDLEYFFSKRQTGIKIIPLDMDAETMAECVVEGLNKAKERDEKPIVRVAGNNDQIAAVIIDALQLPEEVTVHYPANYVDGLLTTGENFGTIVYVNMIDGKIAGLFSIEVLVSNSESTDSVEKSGIDIERLLKEIFEG